jgi:hypothetical protein
VDLGEHGAPLEAIAVLGAAFAVRRSPALAAALGPGWLFPRSGGPEEPVAQHHDKGCCVALRNRHLRPYQ